MVFYGADNDDGVPAQRDLMSEVDSLLSFPLKVNSRRYCLWRDDDFAIVCLRVCVCVRLYVCFTVCLSARTRDDDAYGWWAE